MKKLVAIVTSCLLAVTALAACGGEKKNNELEKAGYVRAAAAKIFFCVAVLIFRSAALPPKTMLTVLDEIPTSCAICLIVTMLFPTFF